MDSPVDVYSDDDYAEKLIAENTLKKLRETHFVGGLKEGMVSGKECALDDGFNYGYQIALKKSKSVGKLRGALSVLLLKIGESNKENKTSEEEKIHALLTELKKFELKQMEEIKKVLGQQDTPDIACATLGNYDTDQEFEDLSKKCTQLCDDFSVI